MIFSVFNKMNVYLILMFVALSVFFGVASSQQSNTLVILEPGTTDESLDGEVLQITDEMVLRARYLTLSEDNLALVMNAEEADIPKDSQIVFKLFSDVEVVVNLSEITQLPSGKRRAYNQDTVTGNEVLLLLDTAKIIGEVSIAGKNYQVRYTSDDLQVVYELDVEQFQPEEIPTAPPIDDQDEGLDSGQLIPQTREHTIDLLVAFTKTAQSNAIGDIRDDVSVAVEQLNASFENSGLKHTVNLVATMGVDYDETGDIRLDRNRLQNPDDGYLDEVLSNRNELKADLVALITETGGCGIAYIMKNPSASFADYAVSVTKRSCAVGNKTLAHEIGHNLGARHDWFVDSTNNSPFDHNHGYVNIQSRWRTIMGYNRACDPSRCNRILRWSNPDLRYRGKPTGIPSGQNMAADNRLTINKTISLVSRFR